MVEKRDSIFSLAPFSQHKTCAAKSQNCRKENMKTRLGFGILLLAVLLGTGRGQEQAHNGFWWVGSSTDFRLGFASGYAMAMIRVQDIEGFRCLADKNGGKLPEKYPGDEALKGCTSQDPRLAPYDFGDIRFGQLSEGIDEFYKDFRNKGIDITMAMTYVRDELKGKPTKELEEELTKWRSAVKE